MSATNQERTKISINTTMMSKISLGVSLLLLSLQALPQAYNRLHNRSIVVDTHNDIPTTAIKKGLSFDDDLKGKTHTDLNRIKQGGVDAQFFSIWCDGKEPRPYALANRQIDTVLAWTNRNPGTMQMATTSADLRQAVKQEKLAVLLGVEGGHMIENSLDKLKALYNRGARYMTLTWNNSTEWATSAADETSKGDALSFKGLTPFGKQVVVTMNALGMMIDLSHVGEQTFRDVMLSTTKPVLVSHSCVYALAPHSRNLKDEQILAIRDNGGVIQVNFFSGFLDPGFDKKVKAYMMRHQSEIDSLKGLNRDRDFIEDHLTAKYGDEENALRPPLSLLVDHMDYIAKKIGTDHVGLGSDFDGIPSLPLGLDDVSSFPLVTKMLRQRGYSKTDIKKILGGNILRVMQRNEAK